MVFQVQEKIIHHFGSIYRKSPVINVLTVGWTLTHTMHWRSSERLELSWLIIFPVSVVPYSFLERGRQNVSRFCFWRMKKSLRVSGHFFQRLSFSFRTEPGRGGGRKIDRRKVEFKFLFWFMMRVSRFRYFKD